MKYIDISRPIHPAMAIYPSNPAVAYEQVSAAGPATSALTRITLGSHTGTHIDAPSHIGGRGGTAMYPLHQLIGPAEVVEILPSQAGAGRDEIYLPPTSASRVLIKTRNSSGDMNVFDPDFIALDESAAQELVDRGVHLVGIDAPSIKKKGVRDRVHAILLDAGVVVLEGLWLADVASGSYELICLPLAVDLDGAPARAVLRQG